MSSTRNKNKIRVTPRRKERRRRRRRRQKSRATSRDLINSLLPEHLLEHVLLQLSSWPVYLFRAVATCKRWCRVIAGFHTCGNVVVGHYLAVKPPERKLDIRCCFEPSAAQIMDRDLSLDFLPRPYGWRAVTDIRDGLVAVVQKLRCVVVCNPWTKQHTPVDLTGWTLPGEDVHGPGLGDYSISFLGAFLVDEPGMDVSSFTLLSVRVVWDYDCRNEKLTAQARMISVRDGSSCFCWYDEDTDITDCDRGAAPMDMHRDFIGRGGGSIFWSLTFSEVLAVDEATGEF